MPPHYDAVTARVKPPSPIARRGPASAVHIGPARSTGSPGGHHGAMDSAGARVRLVLSRPGAWTPPAPDGSGDPLGGLTAAGGAQARACGRWLRSVAVPLFTAGGFQV